MRCPALVSASATSESASCCINGSPPVMTTFLHAERHDSLNDFGALSARDLHGGVVARPIPRVLRVTPCAGEVTEREPDEGARPSGRNTLALDGREDLRLPGRQASQLEQRQATARAGSATPASANPFARNRQLSHRPQGDEPPS